jgi:hypothetical protein
MENKIKETTEKLSNCDITKDEADKILLDLFGVSCSMGKPHDAYIKLSNGEEYRVYVNPEVYYK